VSATLHLARSEDLPKLAPLVAAARAEAGWKPREDGAAEAALAPLLAGSPHGAAYLIGMRRAPLGFITLSFGWSVMYGGVLATVEAFYIRETLRRRGIGTEALAALHQALRGHVAALRVEPGAGDEGAQRLCLRAGFRPRDGWVQLERAFPQLPEA